MNKSLNPLVVSITEADIENNQLIYELAHLCIYLRNLCKGDIREDRLIVYEELGLTRLIWDDLVVMGPGDCPVNLPIDERGFITEIDVNLHYDIVDGDHIKSRYLTSLAKKALLRISETKVVENPGDSKLLGKNENAMEDYSILRGVKEVNRMYAMRLKETFDRLKGQ